MPAHSFQISSHLNCSPEQLLGTLTMQGVNRELAPLVRMTVPEAWRDKLITQWPAQQPLFSSWVLLFSVLPIDRHSFFFDAIDPASGFNENSSTWTNKHWQHQRTIRSAQSGCEVTDTVQYESRLPLLGALFKPVYRWVFARRHQLLRRTYGELE